MTKPSPEALKRAWELVEQPVPRHELGPIIAKDLQELMDQQGAWVRRVENAEFDAKSSADLAKLCELGAREWKAKLDDALRQLEELRKTSIEKLRMQESARAEKAERQLEEEREWFACSQRALAEANARLIEQVQLMREEVEHSRGMRWIGQEAYERLDKLLWKFGDKYGEGGEHG